MTVSKFIKFSFVNHFEPKKESFRHFDLYQKLCIVEQSAFLTEFELQYPRLDRVNPFELDFLERRNDP